MTTVTNALTIECACRNRILKMAKQKPPRNWLIISINPPRQGKCIGNIDVLSEVVGAMLHCCLTCEFVLSFLVDDLQVPPPIL